MKKQTALGAFILAGAVLLQACSTSDDNQQSASGDNNEDQQAQNEKLDVYTTLFAWEDFATQIGGDYVNAENVVPPGSNAHSFDPTPQTLTDIAEGDVFIMTGSGMEGFAEEAKRTVDGQDVSVLEVTNNMELREASGEHSHGHDEEGHSHEEESHSHEEESHSHEEEGHSHSHGGVDPHVWLDPVRAQEAAESIKNELVEQMPEQEETFEKNYEELVSDLESIDQDFQNLADNSDHQQFIVSHAGYGYWEERYGFEQIPVSGINSQNEPSVQEINNIIATAEENDINTVLLEQNIPSQTAETVKDEIGADVAYLHNLSTLTEEDIDNNATYVSLMEENIESLQQALNE
ncbi:metal ABC transporter solute-binding protein, Zn/Mn family [Marinococcus sp. PL1-022]|uniref:metal ABC transporter solute-binding protein, Zn/Mn family n=1 Tax=Marinococcus sp. PL1-022 TaxID=3095363 RepID=UPI0029C43152|nr:zinc ABC transporter substrate-binding protein [Marinococcus sp. PL1-022]MDX6152655.1 zinc ABC transporter substrate-binding protein [Marinococcus sp. PL1-022]